MPAVHDVVFSEQIAQGSVGGAEFQTTILSAVGGWEQRIANWDLGRLRWDLSKMLQDRDVLAYVIAFYRARKGRAYGFLFKDWSDYYVGMSWVSDVLTYTGYEQFGTGDGADTTFQLQRTYYGDLQVYCDRTLQGLSAFSAYSVFDGTGSVTFTAAPLTGVVVRLNGVTSNEASNGARTTFTFTDVPCETRTITRPKRGYIKIYVDGTLKTETTHYSIDYETGVVTFVSAPTLAQKVQWAGQFYVPVRFDSDMQRVMIESYGRGEWNGFVVVEVRE